MDQNTARRLAKEVRGVATQLSRLFGRRSGAAEPWIVIVAGKILHRPPGEGDPREGGA